MEDGNNLTFVKRVVCAKPKGSVADSCCVRKAIVGASDNYKLAPEVTRALVEVLKTDSASRTQNSSPPFPWSSQSKASGSLFPMARKVVTPVAGKPGATAAFKAGIREGARFSTRLRSECMGQAPLLNEFHGGTAKGFFNGGTVKMVRHMNNNTVKVFNVEAGRVLELDVKTGEVIVVFDLCANGFFSKNTWGAFPKADALNPLQVDKEALTWGASAGVSYNNTVEVFLWMTAWIPPFKTTTNQTLLKIRSQAGIGLNGGILPGASSSAQSVNVAIQAENWYGFSTFMSINQHGSMKLYQPTYNNKVNFLTNNQTRFSVQGGPTTMDSVSYIKDGKRVTLVFIAVVSRTRGWGGACWPSNTFDIVPNSGHCASGASEPPNRKHRNIVTGYEDSTIFIADLSSSSCTCVDKTCTKKCDLPLTKLTQKPMPKGIISMHLHPRNAPPKHVYMANFRLHVKDAYSPQNLDSVNSTNDVSVAQLTKQDAWAISSTQTLAGGSHVERGFRGFFSRVQNSVDGTGTAASFIFVHMSVVSPVNTPEGTHINRFAGASLSMMTDVRTQRHYLVVGEGSAHKVRLVDVTTNKPEDAKVTTVGIFVGPRAVSLSSNSDTILISDAYGVMQNLDLYPVRQSFACEKHMP